MLNLESKNMGYGIMHVKNDLLPCDLHFLISGVNVNAYRVEKHKKCKAWPGETMVEENCKVYHILFWFRIVDCEEIEARQGG